MLHALHSVFYPQAIAVIGASDRHGSLGRQVFSQLCADAVAPIIVPVNPSHKTVGGQKSYENIADAVAEQPALDMAIVILSADKLSTILREIAKTPIKQVVLINEIDTPNPAVSAKLDKIAEYAQKRGIALLAVTTLGLQGLLAPPKQAACAYIGQSAGIAGCMEQYARERNMQFSRFVTLNPQNYPVSTGQIIDFIAAESSTTALLIHVSVLDNSRELISALQAASQRKPVIVLTTLPDSEQEMLFNQALNRAKILSVQTLTQFFTAAKLIHTGIISRGNRLHIISNTPHISALARKTLAHTPLLLADVNSRTLAKILPYKPPAYNPLDLPADIAPAMFQSLVQHSLQDDSCDATLVIYAGQTSNDSYQIAQIISGLQKHSRKPLLLTWLGSAANADTLALFNQQKNLHFKQPEHALHALVQLHAYYQHQQKRYTLASFHDYRYAAAAADELHKHLRPLLPVAVLPAGKTNTAYLLTALQTYHLPKSKTPTQLHWHWERTPNFGQVLHLHNEHVQISLLPPISPEIAISSLHQLNLPMSEWCDWLLNACDILCRLPEIHSTTLSLLYHDDKGIACTDAKLNLQDPNSVDNPNVFTPYPTAPEESITLSNGNVVRLRAVRAEDAVLLQRLHESMDERSRYLRFMTVSPEIPPALLAKLSQPDYSREYALLLHDDEHTPLAHAHYTADTHGQSCEFGISIASSLHGQGVGTMLMQRLISHAREQGFAQIRAEILADNHPMQKLALKLGFVLAKNPHDSGLVDASLSLGM
ncbi:GNAT family N-acetyltransferase [Kingella kingae]|uniref:bifunctional acetate--CoA ligase family protein/GNAT family N-acetyltransferase n=1 Tax=Kingella kingae TaxID=504 RepID=UPI0004087192|nr:GNAT family N-acetyltransferase [Kingella kingae]